MGQKARNKKANRAQNPSFGQPGWTPFTPLVIKGPEEVPEGREWLGGNRFRIVGEVFSIFHNSRYSVMVGEPVLMGGRPVIHLSIKRLDRSPMHDWRDLQRIKNELVGPEREGLELFPAESRLMDTSNQYHLYVLADDGERLPYGYNCKRNVTDEPPLPTMLGGAKQRAYAYDSYPMGHDGPRADQR